MTKKEMRNLNVRMRDELLKQAKSVAYAKGTTLQDWVTEIITTALDAYYDTKEQLRQFHSGKRNE